MTEAKRIMRVVSKATYKGQALRGNKGRFELVLEGCAHAVYRYTDDKKKLPKKVVCRECSKS